MPAPPEAARPGRARRSLGLSAIETYAGTALQVAGTVLLARLLAPDDFGVYAMAAVVAGFAGSVRTFGVNEYLIQQRELTSEVLRAALAVVWIVAWVLGGALLAVAPLVARFYGRPEVGQVLQVLALSFFISPLGSITVAWCRRELHLGPVLASSLAAAVVGLVVSVLLATRGFGAISLAAGALAGSAATALVAAALRPVGLPRWPSLQGAAEVFRFGRQVSGVYLYGQVGNGMPELVIGKVEGLVPVAHFGRAQGLVELFNRLVLQAVGPVLLPILAARARADADHSGVAQAWLRGTGYLTAVAWPMLGGIAVLAWPAVRIVYGAQWLDAVTLAPPLCLAAALAVSVHLVKDTLLAIGQAGECQRLQGKVHLLRVAGVLLVVPFGLAGACWGLAGAALAGAWLSLRALRDAVGVTPAEASRAWRGSAAVTVAAVLPVLCLTWWVPAGEHNYVRLGLAGAVLLAGCWLAALKVLRHPLWAEVVALATRGGRAGRPR